MSTAPQRRPLVTGLGPVSPLGIGKAEFWEGINEGRSVVRRATRIDTGKTRAKCAAEIDDFDLATIWPELSPRQVERTDRHSRFALAAAHLAWQDAGLAPVDPAEPAQNDRLGISLGTALGGISDAEQAHRDYLTDGPRAAPSTLALQIFGGASHSNLAIAFGARGPANTSSNSCASGNVALLEACRWIREGLADVVLAGASESPLSPLTFSAFDRIGAMSRWEGEPELASRPFDRGRDGFVMGEGAAVVVVESEEHAMARGACVYGEIAGGSLVNEAYHMTSPRPGGEPVREVMTKALADAGLTPDEIDYLSPHGSATQLNDRNEAEAVAAVFGSDRILPATALKGYLGHALGAASAIEAVATLLVFRHQVHPTGLYRPEPEESPPLRFDPAVDPIFAPQTALSNAFGFGGANASIVLKKG